MAKAGRIAVANLKDVTYYHDIENAAIAAMKTDIVSAIKIYAGK